MAKLFKLCRNENKIDISLYQMYLHENVFKYHRLKLFKEITIGFNHRFMTFQLSPYLNVLMISIFLPQLISEIAQSFLGLSLNCTSHVIIKGIAIW